MKNEKSFSISNENHNCGLLKNEILVAVRFGMAGHDCKNFGICKVEMLTGMFDINNPKDGFDAFALLSVGDQEEVKFKFLKSSISSEIFCKLFNDDIFLVEEKFIFGLNIIESLKLDCSMIDKGIYHISEFQDFFEIRFTLIFKP